jgi:hypothetical protein
VHFATFDLDSTLADTRHRHHLISPDGATDWTAYSLACGGDALVGPVAALWRALPPGTARVVVSARDRAAEAPTRRWLADHNLWPDLMVLGPVPEGMSHEAWKVSRIRALMWRYGHHVFHVDDWPPVGAACARAKIECIVVTPPKALAEFEPSGHLTFV